MAVWDKKTLWGFVFLLAGAAAVSVNYPDPVCAVKGSTVTLPCTFTPLMSIPDGDREVLLEVVRVVWCQNHAICQGSTPSVYDSESNNEPRYRYLGDKKGDCTLQITNLQGQDDATLRFRMEVNYTRGHFTGQQGVKVTVTDGAQLRINSSSGDRAVKRGETVTLHCTAVCTFHQLKVTWFRDSHALSETGPALQLGPLTAQDSGNYSCGLKSINTFSRPYSLHVEEEGPDGGVSVALIVGVLFGVLLAVSSLILLVCIIRRKRAAAAEQQQPAAGGDVTQKGPDNMYSDVLPPAAAPEPSRGVEDVSYASVHFKHKSQDRPAKDVEDSIIYSSVATRG